MKSNNTTVPRAISANFALHQGGAALHAMERLLLPNACIACGRWVGDQEADALVCSRCRLRLQPLLGGCERCRQPLPLIGPCRFCATWPVELAWVRSAVWLEAEARETVHHLKYGGFAVLAAFMADAIVRHVSRPADATLVPIPLTRRRLRQRGYNQAALIARALGARWHMPVGEDVLTRARDAGSQTALTPQERLANVAGAFAATAPPRTPAGGAGAAQGAVDQGKPGPSGSRVVIVDDVLTTGATLLAAVGALAAAGWHRAGAVTFARALPFERRLHYVETLSWP